MANFNTMLKVQFTFGRGSKVCLVINSLQQKDFLSLSFAISQL